MIGTGANDAWEYLRLLEADDDQLAVLGKAGWELVAVANPPEGSALFFKRRLPSFREMVTLDQRRDYYASVGRAPEATEQPTK